MFKTLDDLKKEKSEKKETRPGHFTGNEHRLFFLNNYFF